ncbi:putative membrane protein [Candidatus Phytoplasma solani]|uniref:hypothetical protein n=1 Tax=Candidatus Phytoplasma solani TaxID=69896 RepID=UPI0032DBC12C
MNFKIKKIFLIGIFLNILYFSFLIFFNLFNFTTVVFKSKNVVYGSSECDTTVEIAKEKYEVEQEMQTIEKIKTQINNLININEKTELTSFLEKNTAWLEAEKTYKKIQEYQENNGFSKALELLKPHQNWKQHILSFFVTTNNLKLKEVYQAILKDAQTKIKQIPTLVQEPNNKILSKETKSWYDKFKNQINNLWPSVEAHSSLSEDDDRKNTISGVKKFLEEHPFFTKILAIALGENSRDLDAIISKLARNIFNISANQVKKEAEKAKEEVPEKAKKAISRFITEIIIASVAVTTLVITTIYYVIYKIKNNKTSIKTKK